MCCNGLQVLYSTFQVVCMDPAQFADHVDEEGWSDDDDDGDDKPKKDESLLFGNFIHIHIYNYSW